MSTRYTNFVLTIIAGALCALVYQNATLDALAKDKQCGGRHDPCYVAASSSSGVEVRVVNWQQ